MTTHLRRSSVALIATMATALSAAAQGAAACLPGSGFGIESYTCASCGAETFRDSARVTYKFGVEPVVMAAAATSSVKAGDVVIAVNGSPITTRAGADQFAYPPLRATLTVRRNGSNVDLSIPISGCALAMYERGTVARIYPSSISDSLLRSTMGAVGGRGGRGGAGASAGGVARGGGFAAGGARLGAPVINGVSDSAAAALVRARCGTPSVAGLVVVPDSLQARLETARKCVEDANRARVEMVATGQNALMATPARPTTMGVVTEPPVATVEFRNFGLSLSCRPACVRLRARDGTTYWRFDGYPAFAITSATRDALAAKAGLKDGDVIISVNGLSPLSEEGALALARSDRELTLIIEVSRAGKREKYTLKL